MKENENKMKCTNNKFQGSKVCFYFSYFYATREARSEKCNESQS